MELALRTDGIQSIGLSDADTDRQSLMTVSRHRAIAALSQLASRALTSGKRGVFRRGFSEPTVERPPKPSAEIFVCRGPCVLFDAAC